MWSIKFPNTPDGEEQLLIYYDQGEKCYIKITRKDNVLFRYFWDGYSTSFDKVMVDYILT